MSGAGMGSPVESTAVVTGASSVVFHPLSMRNDADSWIIGRMDTGDFAVMPPAAYRAIALLSGGCTVAEVAEILREETGQDFAVADFVTSLDGLGLVSAINGQARDGPDPIRPSLPRLRPQHLRWLLSPAAPWLALAVIVAAATVVFTHPALVPQYRDLIWSRYSGTVLAVNWAIGWTLVWLHELGHLATARAAGIPARLSLTTRLQFLAAQTDVSGVWAAPRRTRVTVYLAGIAVNLLAAATCLLIIGLAHPGGLVYHLLAAAAVEAILLLPVQFLIFMRTDVYFLVQDLAGCADLYADGSARIRYLARCLWHAARCSGDEPHDPTKALPRRERRAVHAYSVLLVSGTTACIGAAVFFTAPALIVLLVHAIAEFASSSSPVEQADGAVAVAVICGFQALWLRTWWCRHGPQVTAYLKARQPRAAKGGEKRGAHQRRQARQAGNAGKARAHSHP